MSLCKLNSKTRHLMLSAKLADLRKSSQMHPRSTWGLGSITMRTLSSIIVEAEWEMAQYLGSLCTTTPGLMDSTKNKNTGCTSLLIAWMQLTSR